LKDDRVFLQHILDEIEYLDSLRPSLSYDDLLHNKTTEHAVTRSLEIIGEAAKNIPDTIRNKRPDIPWKFMAGLRDKVIHGYFAINYEIVWDVVQHKLPELEPEIRLLYDAMKPED
jgi:uncharacterized protein with HEPN domain